MSLLAKKGTFTLPTSGSIVETGVGFQPKALMMWCTRVTAAGYAVDQGVTFGMATAPTTNIVSASTYSEDNVGTINSVQYIRNTSCLAVIVRSGGINIVKVILTLTSFDSDGFTLNCSGGSDSLFIVHYLALGGTDLTDAWAGQITSPTVASSVGYTDPGFQPDLLLVVSPGSMTAATQTSTPGSKFGIGAADASLNQFTSFAVENSAIPTDLHSLQKAEFIHTLANAGTDSCVANLTSMDPTGFTLNWSTAQATARYFNILALKGGSYKVVADTQKTSTGTQAKTGIGFTPKALMLFGANLPSSASVDATLASTSVGASDGTTEGGVWTGSTDNVSTTDNNSATVTDKILRHATNPSTTNAEADLSSFDSDGYTLDWTTADATAREFISVVFGSSAAPPSATFIVPRWVM